MWEPIIAGVSFRIMIFGNKLFCSLATSALQLAIDDDGVTFDNGQMDWVTIVEPSYSK